jgi:transposase
MVTVFQIATSRGSKIAKEMLGEHFAGFLVTDRWSAYTWVDATRRQLCWSHLIRDFQGFVDRGGRGGEIGETLLDQVDKMFTWWHRVRDGTLDRAAFQAEMKPVQAKIIELLHEAEELDEVNEKKTLGMAKKILGIEDALFTFVKVEGIEPTNNFGERQVRPGAMWRRTSFGTQSEAGSRFVERMLTTVATLRQQKRSVLEFLTDAYAAHLERRPGPSLLP